tara:strand:- start:861 stop:1850 length:990 start_codon:yes stop_codon:yes gene_type:complete
VKEIKASSYSMWVGEKSLSKLDTTPYSKIGVLVDENTKKNCLDKLPKIKKSIIIEIPSGEKNKNINTCKVIWNELHNHDFDRSSLLINLGGGVIGDMGGFCASTYKRGINFINLPTTLMAMVDASIGSKLGINFNNFKNQIGLFVDPTLVIIDPIFLTTLPENELRAGFAEVVKHALISNQKLWDQIIKTPFETLNWTNVITTSLEIKNKIVLADPEEKGERKKLNFGHTFGHAVESYYLEKQNPILHGEAVFIGMLLETEISKLEYSEKNKIKDYILSNFNLPSTPAKKELLKFLKHDKKNKENKINFSILNGIGNCTVDILLSEDEL